MALAHGHQTIDWFLAVSRFRWHTQCSAIPAANEAFRDLLPLSSGWITQQIAALGATNEPKLRSLSPDDQGQRSVGQLREFTGDRGGLTVEPHAERPVFLKCLRGLRDIADLADGSRASAPAGSAPGAYVTGAERRCGINKAVAARRLPTSRWFPGCADRSPDPDHPQRVLRPTERSQVAVYWNGCVWTTPWCTTSPAAS